MFRLFFIADTEIMSPIIVAVLMGIIAAGALWVDHTVLRKKSGELPKNEYIRVFILGSGIGYIASLISTSDMSIGWSGVEEVSDSLKTGMPKF
jgi:hypothetical protein